jgi:hypothetical protein
MIPPISIISTPRISFNQFSDIEKNSKPKKKRTIETIKIYSSKDFQELLACEPFGSIFLGYCNGLLNYLKN